MLHSHVLFISIKLWKTLIVNENEEVNKKGAKFLGEISSFCLVRNICATTESTGNSLFKCMKQCEKTLYSMNLKLHSENHRVSNTPSLFQPPSLSWIQNISASRLLGIQEYTRRVGPLPHFLQQYHSLIDY